MERKRTNKESSEITRNEREETQEVKNESPPKSKKNAMADRSTTRFEFQPTNITRPPQRCYPSCNVKDQRQKLKKADAYLYMCAVGECY